MKKLLIILAFYSCEKQCTPEVTETINFKDQCYEITMICEQGYFAKCGEQPTTLKELFPDLLERMQFLEAWARKYITILPDSWEINP